MGGGKALILHALSMRSRHLDLIGGIMKTLDEFNKERLDLYRDKSNPTPNGIACPKCNNELYDSNPQFILTSYPPRKNVHCEKCAFHGTRLK